MGNHHNKSDSDSNSDFWSLGLDSTGELHVCKKLKYVSKWQNTYPHPNKAVHNTSLILDSISNTSNESNAKQEFFLKFLQQNMMFTKVISPVLKMTFQPLMMMSRSPKMVPVTQTPQKRVPEKNIKTQTGFGSDIPGGHHGTSDWKFVFEGPQMPLEESPQQQNQGTLKREDFLSPLWKYWFLCILGLN